MWGGPIRVGVIGGGIWGNYHLKAAKELEREGKVKLIAIAAKTEETANKHAKTFGINGYTDFKQMIQNEDMDAVTIATPDHLHKEMTVTVNDTFKRRYRIQTYRPAEAGRFIFHFFAWGIVDY